MFLLYSPLNQGLKLRHTVICWDRLGRFLLYSPLNQGLKHFSALSPAALPVVFTLQSIKSRIETWKQYWEKLKMESFYSTVH